MFCKQPPWLGIADFMELHKNIFSFKIFGHSGCLESLDFSHFSGINAVGFEACRFKIKLKIIV